ncbi:MAG: DUF3368 domain-containing protein [Ectothiorhodospiraceae bacterium]|nr:DUF3368 domain-containing protein [Ectothiorhodospiraceae bacterium]
MTDKVIINASPLIFLSRSHHLTLLKSFADEVWVPEPVAEEILQRGQQDITAQAIKKTAWLITQPVEHTPISILEWRLGVGESSVLALGLAHTGTDVIIDDLAGRKCADSLDIPVRGTLGLVLAAKKHGIIPEARPVIEDMMSTGLYLSKQILELALEKVGE